MGYLKLTQIEQDLLDMVPVAPAIIDTKELVKRYFGNDPPFYARPNIVSRMNGIIEKLKLIGDSKYLLVKSNRRGPNPLNYQKVAKDEARAAKSKKPAAKKSKRRK